jgi:CBS domain-containing protein
MKVGQYCKPAVVSIPGDSDVTAAANVMRDQHVGFLAVYKQGDELRRPIGVLTDRDIVLQVTATNVDPRAVKAEDVMTRQPLIAAEGDDLADLLQAMRMAGIRRVPVVDMRGALTGIIALDDVIDLIAGLMCDLSGSIKSEQRQEWRSRPSLG